MKLRRAPLVSILAWFMVPWSATAQLPPDETWQTLETDHFRVHYPLRIESLARRAAERGERAHALLRETFVEPAGGRIDLVVTDHADVSNGFAGVTPWRRIVVYAPPPVDGSGLSYFDDWMELVVTHELAHIFHLDVAGRGGRALRAVLGRPPAEWPMFPNRSLPTWIIEGLAVHYESSLTEGGRIRGTYHDMVVRTAALHGTLETFDQLGGQTPVWPAGQRPYIYGSLFFSDLATRYGPESVGRFVRAVAGQWIPFRIDAASQEAFGVRFSDAYEAWRARVAGDAVALADSLETLRPPTRGEPLTRDARNALHAAFGPDGELAYARSDGRSDAQLRLRSPDGGDRHWMRTNGIASFGWLPDGGVLVAQLEARGPYVVNGDLTLRDADGTERRLTTGGRLSFPHVHPRGGEALAIQEGDGTNRIVRVDLADGRVESVTAFRPDVHWAYPRWSPDGRWIAVSRWSAGGQFELLLLDAAGNEVWRITSDRAVDVSPAWSGDGRWLLWSSDRTGIQNLFAVDVDPTSGRPGTIRQVTHLMEGAAHPAVDPGNHWIVYSRYGPSGWDLERIPFDPDTWMEPLPADPRFLTGGEAAAAHYAEVHAGPSAPYSALRSLRPQWWAPLYGEASTVRGVEVVGPRFGMSAESRDPVERHAWVGEALFEPGEGRWEGSFSYRWAGLGLPILGLSAVQSWGGGGAALARRDDGTQDTLYVAERERSVGATATFLRARSRSSTSLTLGGRAVRETRVLQDASGDPPESVTLTRPTRSLGEVHATAGFSTARGHAFSVGASRGFFLSVQGRHRWEPDLADSARSVPGLDRGFQEWTAATRLYRGLGGPGYAEWVLALRGSGGVGTGPGAGPFFFDVGGASGSSESLAGLVSVGGRGLLFPLRGFPEGVRSGRYAWSGSAELRIPLVLIHRGIGASLLHFDRLSGGLFADGGNAWGTHAADLDGNPLRSPLVSVGGELVLTWTPLWLNPLDLRAGVAVPLSGGYGPGVYVRLGRSF